MRVHITSPLELGNVAELKSALVCLPGDAVSMTSRCRALLPDMVKFSYIPKNELRIHGDSSTSIPEMSQNTSAYASPSVSSWTPLIGEDHEHVLVLEFAGPSRGKKKQSSG